MQRFGPSLTVGEAVGDNFLDFTSFADQELLKLTSAQRGFEPPPSGSGLLDLNFDGVEALPRVALVLDGTAQHRLKLAVRRRPYRQSLDKLRFAVPRCIGKSSEHLRRSAKVAADSPISNPGLSELARLRGYGSLQVVLRPKPHLPLAARHSLQLAASGDDVSEEAVFGSTIRNVTMTPPPWPATPAAQPHRRPAFASAVLAALLGAAALMVAIMALTRPPADPTYSAAQMAAAKTDLCDSFKPAMDAVHVETNGPDAGFGRIALVNGALILEAAVSDPALEPKYRDAAKAVVQAYENLVVESSMSRLGELSFDSAVDAVNAKERVLKELCGV